MYEFIISRSRYSLRCKDGYAHVFTPAGGRICVFPLSVRLLCKDAATVTCTGEPELEDNRLYVRYFSTEGPVSSAQLCLTFGEDEICAKFQAEGKQEFAVTQMEYFRRENHGLHMNDISFSYAPAPRSSGGCGNSLYRTPANADITGCYFAPPPFMMICGNRHGNICWSLLDIPNSCAFSLSDRWGILAERPGGHLRARSYTAPRLLITFPTDEWDGLQSYYDKLQKKGLISPVPQEDKGFPSWWKRFVVDSYGDQITELQYNCFTADDWASPAYNTDWLRAWLTEAERRLGRTDFNIVIDAYWQREGSLDPYPDPERFAELRSFIDQAHARGHKVLLWIIPMLNERNPSGPSLASDFGVLRRLRDGSSVIDYTHDRIDAYLDEFCRLLFSPDPDCLDADGVKIDGPFCISDPAFTEAYAHPERGIGAQELMLYYTLFQRHAHAVKADVLINTSAANPFFENVIHINRIGDMSHRAERNERARIVSIISPNMLMDSDSIGNTADIREDYLAAVIYSVPYLYHIGDFLRGERPQDAEMKALGNLLSLAEKKPWGRPVCGGGSNWLWESGGRIAAACFDGDRIVIYAGEDRGYAFSWRGGTQSFPLYGRRWSADSQAEELVLELRPGEVLEFTL